MIFKQNERVIPFPAKGDLPDLLLLDQRPDSVRFLFSKNLKVCWGCLWLLPFKAQNLHSISSLLYSLGRFFHADNIKSINESSDGSRFIHFYHSDIQDDCQISRMTSTYHSFPSFDLCPRSPVVFKPQSPQLSLRA